VRGQKTGWAEQMSHRETVVEIMDPMMVECLRRMTPGQRLAQASSMWETARIMVRSAVIRQFPDWDEAQIQRETARRMSHGVTEIVPR